MTPARGDQPVRLALVGPTASGKTEAALEVAARLDAEIVSCDSMLVYRGMDIGTAKPTAAQRAATPHHLIDVLAPSESFSVAAYQALAHESFEAIASRGHEVLVAGGSGLHLRAAVDALVFPPTDPDVRAQLETEACVLGASGLYERLASFDPQAAAKIEPGNQRRSIRALEVAAITGREFSSFATAWDSYPSAGVRIAGIDVPRDALTERIGVRVEEMLAAGWLDEVQGLMDQGFGEWLTSSQAIGYAEAARHLAGECTLEEVLVGTVRRTKALARRQMAWFRRDPRIRWFPAGVTGALGVTDELTEYLQRG